MINLELDRRDAMFYVIIFSCIQKTILVEGILKSGRFQIDKHLEEDLNGCSIEAWNKGFLTAWIFFSKMNVSLQLEDEMTDSNEKQWSLV